MKKKFTILLITTAAAGMIATFVLLFTGPRMKVQPSLRTYEAVHNLPPDDAIPFGNAPDTFSENETFLTNTRDIDAGKVYYHYYCVFCHGDNGKGDGPVGVSYVSKPADLSSAAILQYDSKTLYDASFRGTGHSPVLERVVPLEYRKYILAYIKAGLNSK